MYINKNITVTPKQKQQQQQQKNPKRQTELQFRLYFVKEIRKKINIGTITNIWSCIFCSHISF